jgi:hypothetical protein
MLRLVLGETVVDFLKARCVRLLDLEGEGSTIFRNVGNCTPNFVWETHMDGETDGRTDKTKLMCALHDYTNVPKMFHAADCVYAVDYTRALCVFKCFS